jgi:hypothetical protein
MTEPIFRDEKIITVEAKGETLWTLALPYVSGPAKVRITAEATSRWNPGTKECGPGGLLEGLFDGMLPTAPRGALIGKLGGGDSDCPAFLRASDTTGAIGAMTGVFAVGSYCVLDVKAAEGGALFLTMNDKVSAFADHAGAIEVKVSVSVG